MDIPSPDKVFAAKAPPKLARTVSSVINLISWITLPTAFVSMFSDLRTVVIWCIWLIQQLGALKPYLVTLGSFLSVVAQQWRAFTSPAREWLESVLHLHLPPPAWDSLMIAAILSSRILALVWLNARLELHAQQFKGVDLYSVRHAADRGAYRTPSGQRVTWDGKPLNGTEDAWRSVVASRRQSASLRIQLGICAFFAIAWGIIATIELTYLSQP